MRAQPGLAPLAYHEEPDFLLEVLVRFDPTTVHGPDEATALASVAAIDGLVP